MPKVSRFAALGLLLMLTTPSLVSAADRVEALDRTALRVCASPGAKPFASEDGDGVENKIAALFAKDLGVEVQYTWFPSGIGFYRRTLNARRCDIVMGAAVGLETAQSTIPYYRSSYVVVTRSSDNIAASDLSDAALRGKRVGVQSLTPGADLVLAAGLMDTARVYDLVVDERLDSVGERMIKDLAAKKIDAVVIWGPIGGYFAGLRPGQFRVTQLAARPGQPPLVFDIGMSVRFGEPKWKRRVEQFIRANREPIAQILTSYNFPLLPIPETKP